MPAGRKSTYAGSGWLVNRASALAIAAALLGAGCELGTPKLYSADPIMAWVVEAETGKPIQGANVLALWEMQYGLENHGTNYAMVMEAVTDKEGKFSLAAWGPKLVVKAGGITDSAPRLVVFKSGYLVTGGANGGMLELAPRLMKSEWNGKSLQLQRFVGSPEEYSDHLHRQLQGTIDNLFYRGCYARSFPRFLTSVDAEARRLLQLVPRSRLLDLKRLSDGFKSICGDAA